MLTNLLTNITRCLPYAVFLVLFFPVTGMGQDTVKSATISGDTSIKISDSTKKADTLAKKPKKSALSSKVVYSSGDSLRLDLKEQKVYLYNEADIKYENLHLTAGYVEISFRKNEMFAEGRKDSAGKKTQIPEFAQGEEKFKSNVIRYNYNTKRGYIQSVFTKQDDGYLHGKVIKKMEDNITYVKDGSYTTCDLEENPHFEFRFGRAKVIPGKKVVTGPAYMAIANVATPILIPFGFFPNKTGRRSGILIPTYGESANRGFYLQNGGYYWAMSQYTDLTLVGDIYSRGSWAIKPVLNYKYRYHYSGMFSFSTATTVLGSEGSPDYSKTKDFRIYWVHNQDTKARPRSRFSANVNIASSTYNKNNLSGTTQNYLSNTFQSSVNYSTSWNDFYYLNVNLNHNQNTLDKSINFTFPQISFNTNQIFPFRPATRVGKKRWYDNINLKYNFDAENRYNTYDSLLFKPGWETQLQNGIRHSVPISATFSLLKYINWTVGINTSDKMYFQTIRKKYIENPDTAGAPYVLVTDTIPGFANAFEANFNTSLSTRLYGMYQFKKGPLLAIRHMITPSVSFNYQPDYGSRTFGYWKEVENDTNQYNPQRYSIFSTNIYGGPPGNKAGVVSFALKNNLEMKVRNRKDTVTGTKKIMLIEDFTIRTSYDVAKDSLNWSKVMLSGYTTLFKSLRIQYGSSWDMYARDSLGNRINRTEWEVNHRFLRLDNTSWDLGLNYSLSSGTLGNKDKESDKGTPEERMDVVENYEDYIDFDIPWSFSVNYNFHFTKDWVNSEGKRKSNIVQTLSLNGQLNITPKWKIIVMTGYDFVNNELSYTRIDVSRDLHCWEMRFGWTPKGYQQSWEFSINVKAPLLQDMKLNKKKDFRTAF